MGGEPRQRLATVLGTTSKRAAFSARRTAAPEGLRIDVAGVGGLAVPVSAAQARQLISIARPAQYGLGEQTLTDARVRQTWEVPKSRVKINKQWRDETLTPMLAALRGDLGLPEGCRLKAELHAVLVYSPGQFFVPHQDSEKSDAMVATLSLILPGSSKGGTLVIEHAGSKVSYRASDRLLTFAAFYADCRHEVRPVRTGYRVVLTYNLLLAGDITGAEASVPPSTIDELISYLEEHFTTESRLVYLLDHQYTAHGLHWSRLKGVDVARVAALRAAARAADCEIVLALAEVQETWSCEEPYRDRYWYDEDEADDESDPSGLEVGELLDGSISLDTWVDESGQAAQPAAGWVSDAEVCATTPTSTLAPYHSAYEGYMGNYGNTMDRWYRRGAVVVWPRRLDFVVRAHASPVWALDTLAAVLHDGQVERARELVGSVATFWMDELSAAASIGRVGPLSTGPSLGQALPVAYGLDDAPLAAMLLGPFGLDLLTPADAPAFATVVERYGQDWLRTLVAAWDSGRRGRYAATRDRYAWLTSLPELCTALVRCGGYVVLSQLLSTAWSWLDAGLKDARSHTQPSLQSRDFDELADPIAGLLIGAAVGEVPEVKEKAVARLREDDSLLHFVVSVLRRIAAVAPEHRDGSGFDVLARHAVGRLEARLAQPARDSDDWSIDPPRGGCGCALCVTVDEFLGDPTRQAWDWPLKQESRRHVHSRIDLYELPVRHQTRRTGRPYTLVLAKLPTLFEREEQARHIDEADLRWIREGST